MLKLVERASPLAHVVRQGRFGADRGAVGVSLSVRHPASIVTIIARKDKAEAAKMEASFGSQIRNYVLAPYRLAKDLRSGHEVGNVDAVLDGDIQDFIEAYLLAQAASA